MAAEPYKPAEELQIYCRFCKKTLAAQLERSIAGSGRTIDKQSSFEYICSRCHRSHCFFGKDLIKLQETDENTEIPEPEARAYNISEHFLVGERITHPSFETVGTIVGKEPGNPNRILVKFEKVITEFVEDIG